MTPAAIELASRAGMILLRATCLSICLAAWMQCQAATYSATGGGADRFRCGGQVEEQVWSMWDKEVQRLLDRDLVESRLKGQGDVYALYNFQSIAHNAVAMARRCGRSSRLLEVAQLINKAYEALSPGNLLSPGRRWVCRGGLVCNDANRLLNKEVMLNSVQFLGLAASVANALATSGKPLSATEKRFIKETAEVVVEHLWRWSDDDSIDDLSKSAQASPADVTSKSTPFLFTDKPLWLIAIYGELAGIIQSSDRHGATVPRREMQRLRRHISVLGRFFLARISIRTVRDSRLGKIDVADIDRGYWRLHPDNAYAGYEGEEKPVTCVSQKQRTSGAAPQFNVPLSSVVQRKDTGWDLSHARRLVHALDALSRNRQAMQSTFALGSKDLPSKELFQGFANNLIAVVWNGDKDEPLFSNYWSGANGWYRVAYDNGTGNCREGYPPYGMSDSFASGGYATWARYRPEIGDLGKKIYWLINGADGERSAFIAKYYSSLGSGANKNINSLAKFAFFPTLVEVGVK